jgi:hypothetical protein
LPWPGHAVHLFLLSSEMTPQPRVRQSIDHLASPDGKIQEPRR